MEPRIKYRDIPWSVALGVLPGKIIGSFILKPCKRLTSWTWRRRLRKLAWKFVWAICIIIVIALIGLIIEVATKGLLSVQIIETYNNVRAWL